MEIAFSKYEPLAQIVFELTGTPFTRNHISTNLQILGYTIRASRKRKSEEVQAPFCTLSSNDVSNHRPLSIDQEEQ